MVPLSAPLLPDANWLGEQMARPVHKFRQLDEQKANYLIREFSARSPAQLEELLNMILPIKTCDFKVDTEGVAPTVSFTLRDDDKGQSGIVTIALMP